MPIRRSRDYWLQPIPGITFDPVAHSYAFNGNPFQVSVTRICGAGKDEWTMKRIMETKHLWEPRGRTVHRALEEAIAADGDFDIDFHPWSWDYHEWIAPLLDLELWSHVEVIGSEFRLGSLDGEIAGSFDLALVTKDGRRLLADLKTQQSPKAGAYSIAAQLGGYMDLAAQHGITFDGCLGIWSRPGHCRTLKVPMDECWEAWEKALIAYDASRSN